MEFANKLGMTPDGILILSRSGWDGACALIPGGRLDDDLIIKETLEEVAEVFGSTAKDIYSKLKSDQEVIWVKKL